MTDIVLPQFGVDVRLQRLGLDRLPGGQQHHAKHRVRPLRACVHRFPCEVCGNLRGQGRPSHSAKRRVDDVQGIVLRLPVRKAGVGVPEPGAGLELEPAQLQIPLFRGRPLGKSQLDLTGHKRIRLHLVMEHQIEHPRSVGGGIEGKLGLADQVKVPLIADDTGVYHNTIIGGSQHTPAHDAVRAVLIQERAEPVEVGGQLRHHLPLQNVPAMKFWNLLYPRK